MSQESWKQVANILNALSTEKRLQTFRQLSSGKERKEIAEELDITSEALQPYINDFKETGLMETQGKDYVTTDIGRFILKKLENTHSMLERHQLQENIEKMVDAGLTRKEIMETLKNRGYKNEEIISSIALAADETNNLGDPDGIQAEIVSLQEDNSEREKQSSSDKVRPGDSFMATITEEKDSTFALETPNVDVNLYLPKDNPNLDKISDEIRVGNVIHVSVSELINRDSAYVEPVKTETEQRPSDFFDQEGKGSNPPQYGE